MNDLANQFQQYGAPSRARYEASYAPGFDIGQAAERDLWSGLDEGLFTVLKAESEGVMAVDEPQQTRLYGSSVYGMG